MIKAGSPRPTALPRAVPWALAAAWLVVGARFVFARDPGTDAALRGLPLDDSFIHLVYARSLAAFHGFAYNPGVAEAGSTSPLWSILLVPSIWARGLDPVIVAKALGLAVGFVTSLLAARIAQRLAGGGAAVAAGVLIAVDPQVGFAAVSGMEPLLAALLLLLAVDALLAGRPRVAALALGLAPLARPEALPLAVAGGAWLLLSLARGTFPFGGAGGPLTPGELAGYRAARWRWLAAAAAFLAVPSLAWMAHCLAATGRPLPNTFYVKASTELALTGANLQAIALALGGLLGFGVVVLALAVAGAVATLRRAPPAARPGAIVLVAAPVVYLASVAAVTRIFDPDAFYFRRYLVPAFPPLLLLAALGGAALIRAARVHPQRKLRLPATIAALALGLLALPRAHADAVTRYAWNCQNIEEVQVAIGRYLAAHAGPDDLVAASDAGAIRFYGDRPVLDLVGLNGHRVLERGLVAAVQETPPRWVAFQPPMFPGLLRAPGYVEVGRWRSEHYTIGQAPLAEMVLLRATAGAAAR